MKATVGWKINLLWICPCMCIWLGPVLQPYCNLYFKGTIILPQTDGAGRAVELASELSGMSVSFTIHVK